MTTAAVMKQDLAATFESAGYSLFEFTPAEQKAISIKIKKLVGEGRSAEQAVAIAISMVAPSKAKGEAAGSFSATIADGAQANSKIKIKGGDYSWTDTNDGYKIIRDVPIMSVVKKGVKGAPYDVERPELEHYVRVAMTRYHEDHFLPTLFIDHNKDLEFQKPIFAGYVLPRRVADVPLENDQGDMVPTPTVLADLKIKNEFFVKVQAGEYPYHSPELPWAKRRISGLALLNTKPPFFEFPNFTVGKESPETSSEFGSFEGNAMNKIKSEPIGRFDGDGDGSDGLDANMKKLMGRMDAMEAKYSASLSAFDAKFAAFAKKFEGEQGNIGDTKIDTDSRGENKGAAPAAGTTVPVLKGKAEGEGEGEGDGEADGKSTKGKKGTFSSRVDATGKPLPLPIEPESRAAAPAMDPVFVAQFEAQASQLKMLMDERKKEKDELLVKSRLDWAKDELKDKLISSTFDTTMGRFALDEGNFKAIVAEMKKSLPSKPPGDMTDFKGAKAVEPSAPSVARFAQDGPEAASAAAKFAADYRTLKANKIPLASSEEEYVKFQMETARVGKLSA